MLLAIREKSQGWFAYAIVIFITIPFALWGIQSYLGGGTDPVAATVNGEEITQRDLEQQVGEYRDNMRSRLGASYRPELFDDAVLRQQVTERMINDQVLQAAAEDWNLRVSDDLVRLYIQSIPAFQSNNHFDMNTYNVTLRNQGMSQAMFEQRVRQQLVMDQFRNGISNSAFTTQHQLTGLARLRDQQRELNYFVVAADRLGKDVETTEEELKQFYQSNSSRYMVPERVKVEYLLLDPEVVGAQIQVTDDKLRAYYQDHADEFQVPEERKVRHILISVTETADESVVKTAEDKASSLYQRLTDGESFDALAKEFSDDPGSAEQGGDVGWITRGLMAEAFEDKAFSLEAGTLSEPVRTPFGFHLIEVSEIKSGGVGGFESLKGEIDAAYRRAEAEQLFFDQAERLADLSYETPDSLAVAAESLGLEILESDWFDRSGATGDLASPKVAGAAFSEDVLVESNNSEMIEVDQDKVVVLRVLEHEEEHIRPYEEVQEQVKQGLKTQKSTVLAKTEGERLVGQLNAGETSLQDAAASGEWALVESGMVKRNDTTAAAEVVRKAFSLQSPEADKSSFAVVAVASAGDYAVLAVSKVVDGEVAEDTEDTAQKALVNRMNGQLGNTQLSALGRYLRSQAKVELAPPPSNQ
jgi:peptidyl-prolyl cis-trans isomerase D